MAPAARLQAAAARRIVPPLQAFNRGRTASSESSNPKTSFTLAADRHIYSFVTLSS
jgi:hypothetical protein